MSQKKKIREELSFSNGMVLPTAPQKKHDKEMIIWQKLYDLVRNETGIKLDVETLRFALAPFDDEILPEEAINKLLYVSMKGYLKLDSSLRVIIQYMELMGILDSVRLSLTGPQKYIVNINPEI